MFHCFACAVRHADQSVEGFLGFGFSDHSAKKDCIEQVRRRLLAVSGSEQTVNENELIYSDRDLTAEEMERIRCDWASSCRFAPDGFPYPG